MVTLVNKTSRPKTVVLDHPAFRDKRWGFKRVASRQIEEKRDGSRNIRDASRAIVGSLTLPAKGRLPGLHPAIQNCSQVRVWLQANEVAIEKSAPTKRRRGRPRKDESMPPKSSSDGETPTAQGQVEG